MKIMGLRRTQLYRFCLVGILCLAQWFLANGLLASATTGVYPTNSVVAENSQQLPLPEFAHEKRLMWAIIFLGMNIATFLFTAVIALEPAKRHIAFLLGANGIFMFYLAVSIGVAPSLLLFETQGYPQLDALRTAIHSRFSILTSICMTILACAFVRVHLDTRFLAKRIDSLLLLFMVVLCGSIVPHFFAPVLFWGIPLSGIVIVLITFILFALWFYAKRLSREVKRLHPLEMTAIAAFILVMPPGLLWRTFLSKLIGESSAWFIVTGAETLAFLILPLSFVVRLREHNAHLTAAVLEKSMIEQEAVSEHRRNDALRRANVEILAQQQLLEDQRSQIEYMNKALLDNNIQLSEHVVQLKELSKEKDEFLGIVAHDLKNPLAGIASFANILKYDDGSLDAKQRTEFVDHITEAAERMFSIIKNLLDVNALERGGIRVNLQPVELTCLVEYGILAYSQRAAEKQITIHNQCTESPMYAVADEHLMMQVVDNLISNAVKYSPYGKRVFIRIYRTKKGDSAKRILSFEVQDEGPGLNQDDLKKLFGKFARLSAQPTGGEHSTGLGLSIVKKMVEQMNGDVRCESPLGQGASFIVELEEADME